MGKVLLLSSIYVYSTGFPELFTEPLTKDSFENTDKLLIGKKRGGCVNQGISRSFLKLFSVTCSKKNKEEL